MANHGNEGIESFEIWSKPIIDANDARNKAFGDLERTGQRLGHDVLALMAHNSSYRQIESERLQEVDAMLGKDGEQTGATRPEDFGELIDLTAMQIALRWSTDPAFGPVHHDTQKTYEKLREGDAAKLAYLRYALWGNVTQSPTGETTPAQPQPVLIVRRTPDEQLGRTRIDMTCLPSCTPRDLLSQFTFVTRFVERQSHPSRTMNDSYDRAAYVALQTAPTVYNNRGVEGAEPVLVPTTELNRFTFDKYAIFGAASGGFDVQNDNHAQYLALDRVGVFSLNVPHLGEETARLPEFAVVEDDSKPVSVIAGVDAIKDFTLAIANFSELREMGQPASAETPIQRLALRIVDAQRGSGIEIPAMATKTKGREVVQGTLEGSELLDAIIVNSMESAGVAFSHMTRINPKYPGAYHYFYNLSQRLQADIQEYVASWFAAFEADARSFKKGALEKTDAFEMRFAREIGSKALSVLRHVTYPRTLVEAPYPTSADFDNFRNNLATQNRSVGVVLGEPFKTQVQEMLEMFAGASYTQLPNRA